jgi:uncharacterized protein (TIGR00251 family)
MNDLASGAALRKVWGYIRVKVTAGASREHVEDDEGVLSIFVKEPPQDNMANRRVVNIVAERLGTTISNVRIVSGHHARNKTLEIKE